MVLLQLRSDLDTFLAYPKLDVLKQRLRVVAQMLRDSFLGSCDATKIFLDWPIEAKDIRSPLDCRRTSVGNLQWKPLFPKGLTIGSQPDLAALVHVLVEVQRQSNKVLPMVVDETIHYRLYKMMHSKSCAQYNLALFFSRYPVLYGMWHPYT